MQDLIYGKANSVIPGFQRIYAKMREEQQHYPLLQAETDVKRQAVQAAMHKQMVPVLSLCFCQVRGLKDIVPNQMAEEKLYDFFHHESTYFSKTIYTWDAP